MAFYFFRHSTLKRGRSEDPLEGLHGVRGNVTKRNIVLLSFEQMDVADDVLLHEIARHRNDK